jgi:hypothetical protein
MSLDTILAAKVQIKFVFLSSRQKKWGKDWKISEDGWVTVFRKPR